MAAGDRNEKRLIGPTAVGTTDTVLGTVPSARVWVTKQIVVCNTNGVDAWLTLAIGSTGTAANCLMYQLPIAGNDMMVFDTAMVLSAAETLNAVSDRTGVTVTAVGWEKEV